MTGATEYEVILGEKINRKRRVEVFFPRVPVFRENRFWSYSEHAHDLSTNGPMDLFTDVSLQTFSLEFFYEVSFSSWQLQV